MILRRPRPVLHVLQPKTTPSRDGFTLLEVLIATGLTVFLMAAVFSSILFFRRLSENGRAEVLRSQLTRSILDSMTRDIRSVVFVPVEEDSEYDTEYTEEESYEEEEFAIEIDPATAFTTGVMGITGDASQLVMQISRPERELNYAMINDGTEQSSDMLMVGLVSCHSGRR